MDWQVVLLQHQSSRFLLELDTYTLETIRVYYIVPITLTEHMDVGDNKYIGFLCGEEEYIKL